MYTFSDDIIFNTIIDKDYYEKYQEYLVPEIFHDQKHKKIITTIQKHFEDNVFLSFTDLQILFKNEMNNSNIAEQSELIEYLRTAEKDYKFGSVTNEVMNQETEKYIKTARYKNALIKGTEYLDNTDDMNKSLSNMEEAISVDFNDDDIYDFSDEKNIRDRFSKQDSLNLVKTGFKPFDDMMGGGLEKKTFNVIMSPTNHGKTLTLAALAASCIRSGLNVSIFTMEISKEKYAERIDANILQQSTFKFKYGDSEQYITKLRDEIQDETNNYGKLFINDNSFTNVITMKKELKRIKMKFGFYPDIIFLDYITIAKSIVMNKGNSKTYELIASMVNEFRGHIAKEFDLPIMSAMQSGRDADKAIEESEKSAGSATVELSSNNVSGSYDSVAEVDTLISQVKSAKIDNVQTDNEIDLIYTWSFAKKRHSTNVEYMKVGVNVSKQTLYPLNNFNNVEIANQNAIDEKEARSIVKESLINFDF